MMVVRIRGRHGDFWLRPLLRSRRECLGGLPKWRQAALPPGDDALGSWACSLPNSPSKLEHLFAQHCEAPDLQEREAAWPRRVSLPHVERLTRRILLRHASWRPAYSATASGLTDLKKKLAHADAQCTNKSHAPCTSFTRGILSNNSRCSAANSARCLRTKSGCLRGVPKIFIPCCSVETPDPRHTLVGLTVSQSAPTRHKLVGAPQTHSTLWSCPLVWRSRHGAAMLPRLQRRPLQFGTEINVVQKCHHLLIITETPVDHF